MEPTKVFSIGIADNNPANASPKKEAPISINLSTPLVYHINSCLFKYIKRTNTINLH